ncbi:MAG: hypothetical protein H0U49_12895 [Parachlamydiaceae bacterium]|nr:hypothetical protein [Parachlamydiaceae bacterium]
MVDFYLQAMMHGLIQTKREIKDKYDEVIEKNIKEYVDSLAFEEGQGAQLVSVKMKKNKLFEELKEDFKMPKLAEFLDSAVLFIKREGLRYIESSQYETLLSELDNSSKILELFDPVKEITVKLQNMLQISDKMMDAINEIAKAAFKEDRTQGSLSLLVFLTTLDPTDADYWFRMGIAAQKCEDIDLALQAYSIALDMDAEIIGARVFSAECYLIQGNQEFAMNEISEAKKIIEHTQVDAMWLDLLATMEEK